jgi:pimeloyl-ACP methyl ester carboxylesterase
MKASTIAANDLSVLLPRTVLPRASLLEDCRTDAMVSGLNPTRYPESHRRAFLARAMLLRMPMFSRAERAADLFCTPLPGTRARALKEPSLGSATPQVVSSGGESYQAYVYGDPSTQPYVLCAHGWSSFGLRFAPWAAAANAAGYALVSFDHGAHGRSSGKFATFPSFIKGINVMRAAFGEPAAGVGHSFGAAALAVAAAENALHCPLILVSPPADLRVAIRFFTQRTKLPPRYVDDICAVLSARAGRDVREFAVKNNMASVRQPILVIHDVADNEVSWNAGAQYAMLAPNARILTTTDLGHHRILNDTATLAAAFAHIQGVPQGEKLPISNADLQDGLR